MTAKSGGDFYHLRSRHIRKEDKSDLKDLIPDVSPSKHRIVPETEWLSSRYWMLIFVFVIITFVLSVYLHTWLPQPLSSGTDSKFEFSEVNTRKFLNDLSNLGPKPSGSHQLEVEATNLLLKELRTIKENALDGHKMEIDVQRPSGCYDLHKFDSFTLCYRNVVNVVVRFGPRDTSPTKHSVMINCHYDTWPDSPGASDDGVSCSLMLEIVRIFSQQSVPLDNDVIFLFNGAEENILQAAHGFITQHPWRHSIRAFINLEAAGAGGREILFQAGPGNQWLLNTYLQSAPRPHCSVMAQEIFDFGLVPGDTDFRIFRDFGRISGLDLAFIRNGYVYHTEFDRPEYITNGSVQRAGDNVLSTLRALISSPYLGHPADYKQGRSVFFDVLGLFTIVYPLKWGELLNYATVMLVVLKVIWNFVRHNQYGYGIEYGVPKTDASYSAADFVEALLLHCASIIVMIGMMFGLSQIVTFSGLTLVWYSTPWLVLFIYCIPVLTSGLAVHAFAAQNFFRTPIASCTERCIFDAHLVLLAVIVQILTMNDIASAFLFLILLMFPLMRDTILYVISIIMPKTGTCVHVLLYCHLFVMFPPTLMISYCVQMMLDMFVPIMGRSFQTINPEYVISGQCTAGAISIVTAFCSLMYVSDSKRVNRLFIRAFVVVALVYVLVMTTPLGRPFHFNKDGPRLRRISLQHTVRHVYSKSGQLELEDNGLFFAAWDYRGTSDMPKTGHLAGAVVPGCPKEKPVYCDIPYYIPVAKALPYSAFLWKSLVEVPYNPHPTELKLVSKREIAPGVVNLTIYLEGSDHMSLYLTPQKPWRLHRWSFTNRMPQSSGTVFVYLAYGTKLPKNDDTTYAPWTFSLVLSDISSDGESIEPSVNVAVASHYLHGKEMHSKTLASILDEIKTKRNDPSQWRWAMTANSWCAQVVSKYF